MDTRTGPTWNNCMSAADIDRIFAASIRARAAATLDPAERERLEHAAEDYDLLAIDLEAEAHYAETLPGGKVLDNEG